MVAFVAHLLPAGRASVGVLEGISEALAAEDVATLCRNNDTPILHNLENKKEQPSRVSAPEQQVPGVPLPPPGQ